MAVQNQKPNSTANSRYVATKDNLTKHEKLVVLGTTPEMPEQAQ